MKFAQDSVPPEPESAYITANSKLAINLERLEDLVARLRNRLTPVLSPDVDCKAEGESDLRATPAPLVVTLEHHAARADNIGDEISSLMHRLCL